MSGEVKELLAREGMDDVDELMRWARERAADLAPSVEDDDELGPLLEAGGQAGDAPPAPVTPQPRVSARREPSNAAPLPPIPVSKPATRTEEVEEIDDIEELDAEELELLDEVLDEDDEPSENTPPPGPPPGPPPVARTPGSDEGSAAQELPPEAPSYGPPDGNEVVPEWKAALLSTQTQSDEEAAERVKEASSVGPLPSEPDRMPVSSRLEAEEDEISQHSVDLSDLDLD